MSSTASALKCNMIEIQPEANALFDLGIYSEWESSFGVLPPFHQASCTFVKDSRKCFILFLFECNENLLLLKGLSCSRILRSKIMKNLCFLKCCILYENNFINELICSLRPDLLLEIFFGTNRIQLEMSKLLAVERVESWRAKRISKCELLRKTKIFSVI